MIKILFGILVIVKVNAIKHVILVTTYMYMQKKIGK